MKWNLESPELIKLLDDKVMNIVTYHSFTPGFCSTCDFGSIYVQTITVEFEDGIKVYYEIENEHGYALSEAKLMRFFTNNLENFSQMTRSEFCTFLKRLEERSRDDEEICEIYRTLED